MIAPEASRTVEGNELPLLSASTKESTAHVSLSNLDAAQPRTVVLDLPPHSYTTVALELGGDD